MLFRYYNLLTYKVSVTNMLRYENINISVGMYTNDFIAS